MWKELVKWYKERYGYTTFVGYKWIREDMHSYNGHEATWEIGKWKKFRHQIDICANGYHASPTPAYSIGYSYGPRWFLVEAKCIKGRHSDKFVCKEMRLVKELPAMEIFKEYVDRIIRTDAWHNISRMYKNDLLWILGMESKYENISTCVSIIRSVCYTEKVHCLLGEIVNEHISDTR